MSPVEVACPGHYIEDMPPSPPLFGCRLTSVDEGVVLESCSDATNSRERLPTGHFENGHMEDMHERNEEENSRLSLRVLELEALLDERTSSGAEISQEWNERESYLLEVAEEERRKLCTKLQECQDELQKSASKIASLCETEQALRSEISELRAHQQENREPSRSIWELEIKLEESEVKLASVKEYERRLRAELCKEMTKKVVQAQSRSRELGDTILVLESKLRETEQQYLKLRQTDSPVWEIFELRDTLESTESQNEELNKKVQQIQVKLQEAQDIEVANKEEVLNLRDKICRLEKSEVTLREKARDLENIRLSDEMSENRQEEAPSNAEKSLESARERKVKNLKFEKAALRSEVKMFRENSLALESQLLQKDKEILCLKNQVVDLRSEITKVDAEFSDLIDERSDTEKKLSRTISTERKVQSELSLLHEDYRKLTALSANDVRILSLADGCFLENACKSAPSNVTEERMLLHNLKHPSDQPQDGENTHGTIEDLQQNITELSQEKEMLERLIDQLGRENARLVQENQILVEHSNTMGDRVRKFSEDKESLSQKCNFNKAENETLRTYASLCTDEANSLKAHLSAHRKYVTELEEKVNKLELEMIVAQGDLVSGTCDTTLLQEQKITLEMKIQEASRVVDRVKEELVNLTNGVLTLQKELASVVDTIVIDVGLEEQCKQALLSSPMTSTDSNHYSSFSSDDIGSDVSDVFGAESILPCVLFLGEECFLNPTEISIVRENRAEILILHEKLKTKLLIVKDAIDRGKDASADVVRGTRGFVESPTDPGLQSSSCDSVLSEERRTRKRIESYMLPALGRVEKARLSSLLTSSKTQDKEADRDSQQSVYDAYLELEDQFLKLSEQLVTKEDEFFTVLVEKKKFKKELDDCQKGIILCEHCAAKDPKNLEESRRLLKTKLLSHIEETARLEAEMMEMAEYRDKLQGELSIIKKQVTTLEEELPDSVREGKLDR